MGKVLAIWALSTIASTILLWQIVAMGVNAKYIASSPFWFASQECELLVLERSPESPP